MSFCSNCGSSLKPTDTFCSACGEQVKSVKPDSSHGSGFQSYQAQNPPQSPHDPKTYSQPKTYYRSPNNKVIAGVCGGLAEYFDIDPVLVRVAFLLFALFGVGLVAYLILALIPPTRPYMP